MFISAREVNSDERQKFRIQKKLSDGIHGSFFIALNKKTKNTVVVKCAKVAAKAKKEIEILNLLGKSKSESKKYIGMSI